MDGDGFYYTRREAALTERGVSDRPIPVFGYRNGQVSARYIRNQINAGAVKREVPLTTFEKASLDFLDEQTRRGTAPRYSGNSVASDRFCPSSAEERPFTPSA